MNALPKNVRISSGQTFNLTKEIGSGGEGAVFEASGAADLAFKLYWPNKAQERLEKLKAMASAEWYKTNPFVAFPIDLLFSNGAFVGFVMKKVGGHKPVHLLFSPASRKLEFGRINFRFLVRSAGNIARAVSSVHGTGCVIGDVNESGFLVSEKATSIIIDSDSFQVAAGQKQFLCHVGKPEYTPPELQSLPLDKTLRTQNHDNFGLAVLVFQLLFMGKHPFSGRYSGREDMPISLAISQYRFAYSDQRALTKMQPPPGAPLLSDFPSYIAEGFENAFGKGNSTRRPTAAEWVKKLKTLESELVQCLADNNHHHVKGKPCPWCRMEQSSPGFIAFGAGRQTVFVPTTVNANQFYAILNSISDPGPWPDFLAQLVVSPNLVATPAAAPLLQKLKNRALTGLAASASGAILICYGGGAIFPGLGLLGLGLAANALPPRELAGLRQAQGQAANSLKAVRDIWNKEATDNAFGNTKSAISEKLRQLSEIPNEEKKGIAELERRKKDLQLKRYLSTFLIKKAKISKVGTGRKATLASYNIETAADVDPRRIQGIPGFGPSLVSELVNWQRGLTTRFVFNPNEPTNPADLSALKSKLSGQKSALERSIRDSLNTLQQIASQVRNQQKKLGEAASRASIALKQAELNVQAADGSLQKASKFISFCCAALAAWGLLTGGSTVKQTASLSTQNSPPAPSKPAADPWRVTENTLRHETPQTSLSTPQIPRPSGSTPAALSRTPTALSNSSRPDSPPFSNVGPRVDAPSTAPVLPPPQEISGNSGAGSIADQQRLYDLGNPADATQVQQRLISLGHLSGVADGKWGPKSKRALAEFKVSKQFSDEATWDLITQQKLFDPKQEAQNFSNGIRPIDAMAAALFGGWTASQGDCGQGTEPPPMTISAIGAASFGGFCEFSDIRQEANNIWRVAAKCTVGNESWPANIRLALTASSLRWSSEKGEQTYFRCPSRNRF